MTEIATSLVRNTPGLVAWLVGIILAVRMVRVGGGKAEKLLLIGCSLMLAVSLINPLLRDLMRWWMSEQNASNIVTAQRMGLASIPAAILGIAALVCLVWAFWLRFRVRRREVA